MSGIKHGIEEVEEVEEMFYPLSKYYRDYGIPMPKFESVQAEALPEPYRHLLVHESDMTGRLTAFHGETMGLRVIEKKILCGVLARRVVLYGRETSRGVEFGEILIYLNRFQPEVRELIEACEIPLGGILVQHQVGFFASPRRYLKIVADEMIAGNLGVSKGTELYGRKNKLTNYEGETLAEIIEILPPTEMRAVEKGNVHE